MADHPDSLVLELLRAIRADVSTIKDDVREIKARLTSLERANAGHYADVADQHARYDRLAERIERIERRLELTPP